MHSELDAESHNAENITGPTDKRTDADRPAEPALRRPSRCLIVGLGNPGRKYEGTRHNIGFVIVAALARKHGAARPKARFSGEIAEISIGPTRVIALCPLTYMNLSGQSVVEARDFYKVAHEDLLVVCDDFHLPLGKLRFRPQGSAGGQKGLQNIIDRLGNQQVPRLRFGVGQPPPRWDPADYVLGRFSKDEIPQVEKAVDTAVDAIETWVADGIQTSMNQYNG